VEEGEGEQPPNEHARYSLARKTMSQRRLLNVVALILVAAVSFLASGCHGGSTSANPTQPTTVEVKTVKPSVESVEVVNTGTPDKYYAILDVTVRNDGADGMAIIVGSITQGTQTPTTSEIPVYLTSNSKQVIRIVLPLKWGGGEFTAKAEVHIP
jgi:hypothetical protein